MTDERVIRMAQEHAALVVAVRLYVITARHQQQPPCRCGLCEALAVVDRPKP